MANVQVKLDESLKNQAQMVASGMGIDLASAIRMFITQMVRENGMPFRPYADSFYSTRNQEFLERSLAQLKSGQVVTKTLDELDKMAK